MCRIPSRRHISKYITSYAKRDPQTQRSSLTATDGCYQRRKDTSRNVAIVRYPGLRAITEVPLPARRVPERAGLISALALFQTPITPVIKILIDRRPLSIDVDATRECQRMQTGTLFYFFSHEEALISHSVEEHNLGVQTLSTDDSILNFDYGNVHKSADKQAQLAAQVFDNITGHNSQPWVASRCLHPHPCILIHRLIRP
ncbi:hypothetical protein J6590_022315 [Homalodisca vitripennis]|nr:hypothetical protein J6590_022315 [Homalodisca vitripennis]